MEEDTLLEAFLFGKVTEMEPVSYMNAMQISPNILKKVCNWIF